MIVAYQGAPGAFGHEAAGKAADFALLLAVPSFAAVVDTVCAGKADVGVLPVENRHAGKVDRVAELIADSGLLVDRIIDLPVRLHLLGKPGTRLGQIETVVSHPMALRQCARRLAELGVDLREVTNTAIAAQSLADGKTAALASSLAAELYGLALIEMDLQDDPENVTHFAVLVRPSLD